MFKFSEEGIAKFIIFCFVYLILIFVSMATLPGNADSHEVDKDSLNCLAKNIYFEARGEEIIGQYAIGLVTLNRVKDKDFPNNICDVVHQAIRINNKIVKYKCQFSWYCDGKSDTPKDLQTWYKAINIADTLLHFNVEDFTRGSRFYHADYVVPEWSKNKKVLIRIGKHIFYE